MISAETDATRGEIGFPYRPALDGLRAVAVVAVFAYHLRYAWAPGGFLGVDLFFVLSGYLITSLLIVEFGRTGSIRLTAFWARRARRLLPAVFLLLLAFAAFAAWVADSAALADLRADGLSTLFYVVNWHFIASEQSYFDSIRAPSPLRHMWSLAIEEQFYLICPLGVAAILRLRSRWHWALAGFCAVGVAVSAGLMALLYEPSDPSRAYYGSDARAHELLVGVALAVVLASWKPATRLQTQAVQVVGAASAISIAICFSTVADDSAAYYLGGSLVFSLLVAGAIAACVHEPADGSKSFLGSVLTAKPMIWLGQISYGLYLWHWFAIVVLTPSGTGLEAPLLDALQIASALSAATLSYFAIELPIRRGAWPGWRLAFAVPVAMSGCALAIWVATTGATADPFEVGGSSGELRVSERPGGAPSAGRSLRTLLVGDSVARTMASGFEAEFESRGHTFNQRTFPGCGISAGFMLDANGEPYDWSEVCLETGRHVQDTLDLVKPDLVIWSSRWETADRREAGQHLRYGTPAHTSALTAALESTYRQLSANGARVVLLRIVHRAAGDFNEADDASDGRIDRYNAMLDALAEAHPENLIVVDAADILCPAGPPCPSVIEGFRPRGEDGAHFSQRGARWLAARLVPRIIDAVRPSREPRGRS